MKFVFDLHTHTINSGHAHCTTMENAKYASEIGLEVLGITDHGPKMPNAPHEWYFGTFDTMPREIYGVTMLYGCEANILEDGSLDLPEDKLEKLDIIIGSIHEPVIEAQRSPEIYTEMFLKAMENPNLHILGHIGNPKFPIYEEEIVKKAKEKNILIEINNKSFSVKRKGSDVICKKVALLCKEYGVKVVVGSDAHSCFAIGGFNEAEKLLKEVEMPESLIMNTNKEKIFNFLRERGKNI
ncbi:phosphatase [Clostridium saccharoperbutylacetonicum]|uniref:phosphatase n=1 Tax=Clostridium saccharoperbutylacetonicum TaxID=36745 RepID=UPI0039ED4EF0